jgi:ADP-dependent NAD(P)H-hydrate dehydratase / NAD(P)H-hydrate epimerase
MIMKIVTAEQMKQIDRAAIDQRSIPSLRLMEHAGKAVATAILDYFPDRKRIAIFVGKGNNGGDALVVARLLHQKRKKVNVYLTAKPAEMSPDAKSNLNKYLKLRRAPKPIEITKDTLPILNQMLATFNLIIDGLLGTGTKGNISGLLAELIPLLNEAKKPMVAIDLPSGLDADTGKPLGAAIRAALTVTLGLPKPGLVTYPGAEHCGKLVIADIGLPQDLVIDNKIKLNWLTGSEMKSILPVRKPDTHKNDFGHIFVLAGSVGFTGAAALTSLSALRAGAGLVTLGIPKSLNDIMESKLTEVMKLPLPETGQRSLALDAEQPIMEFAKKATVLAIGPGLSLNEETKQLVRHIMVQSTLPMVIDADGITAISEDLSLLQQAKAPVILTPHPGEMARLLHSIGKMVQSDRIELARKFAQEYKVILVLKGARTVIADPTGQVYLNPTGNSGMASAGVGDVLTGIIAGFLGQKLSPLNSALLGVYLHGLAADLAAEQLTQYSLIASDIISYLPQSFRNIMT